MSALMKFFSELRRRNVIRTLVAYLGIAWLVLQVVSVVFPILNLSPLTGTFITVLLIVGFPVVFYLSWYFEITSEGIKRTAEDTSEPVKPLGKMRWLGLAVIVLGSMFLGYQIYGQIKADMAKSREGTDMVKRAESIAVMPFRDLSPDQDQAYLAEGIAEELTGLLGQLPNLTVASFGSALKLSEQGLTPVDAARRLGVQTILSGSVRSIGDRLKLRLELIDSGNGHTLWTDNIQRKLSDVFAIETEIGRSVVNLLQDNYLQAGEVTNSAKTSSTDAYVIYLKGREQYRKQTTESLKQARKYFEQAIAIDPEYALAYVGLADAILMLSKDILRFGILEPEIASQLAEQNLAKAFVRQADIPLAYAIQGKVFELQQKPDETLAAYDKAISLNPNLAIAHMWRYLELKRQNRYAESLQALEKAYQLDPVSIATMFNRAVEMTKHGQLAQAKLLFSQLIRDFPESPMGHQGLAGITFQNGELAQSLLHWKTALDISPENITFQHSYLDVLFQLNITDQPMSAVMMKEYKTTSLLVSGQYNELFKQMEFQLAAQPDDPWLQFEAAWYQLLVGEQSKGIKLATKSYKGFSEVELYAMPYCSPGIEIAWAMQQSERQQEAQTIINRCDKQVSEAQHNGITNNIYTYLSARIAALNGDNSLAIEQLDKAVKKGWREWWTDKDPLFTRLKDNPEFQHISQQISQDLALQRAKAKELLNL